MTDWLKYILELAVSHEEESEELPELPTEAVSYTTGRARRQEISSAEETPSPVRGDSGIRLLQAFLRNQAPPADIVPAAILSHAGEASGIAEVTPVSEDALAMLYRRSVDTAEHFYLSGFSPGAHGQEWVVVVQEPAAAAPGLTAGELDRAVRRDSRRYDGGMTIY